ncbi:MAG: hypothetical protein ACE5NJ_09700 [Thermodesulfobacteriota bacterium]
MKTTVSIKGTLIAFIIFFIGASSLCYLFFYRPKSKKAVKSAREIPSLEGELES